MRGLAREGDLMPLDAERPEHHAQRQAQRLEHGPLLDVQFEVGRGTFQLTTSVERTVEIHPVLAQRVGKRHAVAVPPLA